MKEKIGTLNLYLLGFTKKYINTLKYFEEESKIFHIKRKTYSIRYLDKKIYNQPTDKMAELGYLRKGMVGHFIQFKKALANYMISEKLQELETMEIEKLPAKELKRKTLKHQSELYKSGFEKYDRKYYNNGYLSNYTDKELKRWEVNYIRHKMTPYNHVLWEIKNKYLREDLSYSLFETVMLNMRETYPSLAEEIDRQLANYFEKYQKYTTKREDLQK